MDNRPAFAPGLPVRFFVASVGESCVRGIPPSPISWSWWGGVDAAMVNVRHLSPRSRSGGYCLDDVFVDWVSFLLLRFFSCGFSRFFSRFFSCGFLSRFPLYLLGVWCSVLPRTKSAERIVPTRHPSGGRLTLSSCCWRWRHQ